MKKCIHLNHVRRKAANRKRGVKAKARALKAKAKITAFQIETMKADLKEMIPSGKGYKGLFTRSHIQSN